MSVILGQNVEEGVMAVQASRAWGRTGEGGYYEGWMSPCYALIHDPENFKKPEQFVYPDHPKKNELRNSKLVKVRRTITVEIIE
jgi:hypothetical protein